MSEQIGETGGNGRELTAFEEAHFNALLHGANMFTWSGVLQEVKEILKLERELDDLTRERPTSGVTSQGVTFVPLGGGTEQTYRGAQLLAQLVERLERLSALAEQRRATLGISA